MPKKPEIKKLEPQPHAPSLKGKAIKGESLEPKVIIFRLYECVLHLEESLNQLKRVGIFPGPEDQAAKRQFKHKELVAGVENLYKEYLAIWGEMPKP